LYKDSGGLGFSIAGGRGSLPYKGNDEVCFQSSFIILENKVVPQQKDVDM